MKFQQFYRAYPVAMMPGNERDNLSYGGKVVLPQSALNKLTMLNISYPMLFELASDETGLKTYGGVLEFTAEEGRAYLPQWMMETLAIASGGLLKVTNTNLELGTFVKIEPQSVDFLNISDPKAVLENALRNYSTLTVDDVFQISYNDKIYSIKVLEAKPETESRSICVVETDLEVDFAPPVGYVEPSAAPTPSSAASRTATATPVPQGTMAQSINYEQLVHDDQRKNKTAFDPFAGGGHKLSGRPDNKKGKGKTLGGTSSSSNNNEDTSMSIDEPAATTTPLADLSELPSDSAAALNLPFGQLFFGYPVVPLKHLEDEQSREDTEHTGTVPTFSGAGQSLRKSLKRKDASKQGASKRMSPAP